jgi:hypothetical protein
MKILTIRKVELYFKKGRKPKKTFIVYTNMPLKGNINSLHAAFDSWVLRTTTYTAESFVEYVRSKETGYATITQAEYEEYQKELKELEGSGNN